MTSMYVQYYDVVSHVPAENLAVLLSLAAGSYLSTYHYHFMWRRAEPGGGLGPI